MSPPSRKRPRRGKILPTPRRSARLYVSIEPSRVGMFRFLLEAADNLALMSVVDRFGSVLQIRFSPHQEREVREFLTGMRERLPFEEIPVQGTLGAFSGDAPQDLAGGNGNRAAEVGRPPILPRCDKVALSPSRAAPRTPSCVGLLRSAEKSDNGDAGDSIPCRGVRGAEPPEKGSLVYVMGPSGCGKDSLLRGAARVLGNEGADACVAFVRRYITRPAEAGGEDHMAISVEDFAAKRAAGFFALDWESHGLCYGIAAADIDERLAEGLTVVLNGSRAYLPEALRRHPRLIPVLITVRPEILRDRLLARGRETPEEVKARLSRIIPEAEEPEGLIRLDNSGRLADAVETFTALLLRISRASHQ